MANKTSEETKRRIKRKTVYAMPDRPSEKGIKAEAVKRAFWSPLLDDEDSLLAEMDRVVDEVNNDLNDMEEKVDALKATVCKLDEISTVVAYTFIDNESKSFMADGITDVTLVIPEDISVGFSACVNIKIGDIPPEFTFVNHSSKAVKKLQFCSPIDTYIPQKNVTCRILVDCDEGTTVCVWIVEA